MSIKRQDVTLQSLPAELQKIFASRADKTVYLRADQDVPYGLVVEAMAIAKQAGADRLSIITQPEEKRKP